MKFLDDENLQTNNSQKPVSSTIELAKKLGILKDEELEAKNSTTQNQIDKVNIELDTQNSTLSKEPKDLSEQIEKIDISQKPKKAKKEKNHLVDSDDIEEYLKEENLKYVTIQEGENSTIKTDDYIYDSKQALNSNKFIPFVFKGKAKEYFKIWIVNIALTILTLGIYSAWAKVRNNRYIYGNTYLNGSNFEYNAEPKRLLYGRLIVVGFYGLFYLATKVFYSKTFALIILALFLLLLPWLIRQAVNFRLKSASYRNIHFKYNGKARSFYKLAIGALLLFGIIFVPAILAGVYHTNRDLSNLAGILTVIMGILFATIILPILYLKFKELIINNSAYGLAKFNFDAKKSEVIGLFLRIGMVTFLFSILLGLASALGAGIFGSIFNALHLNAKNPIFIAIVYIGIVTVYIASLGLYKGISDGYLSNFVRNHTSLKDCPLKGEISPIKLGFISMSNAVLVLLSLGLLYPWAKMRYLKYKIENTYFKCKDYNQFKSAGREKASTVGEETMDFFDIDIGV